MKDNKKAVENDELLKEYYAQVEDAEDQVHTHVDYHDYSDYTDHCC